MGEKSSRARREEEILAFWQENHIFASTLAKKAPRGEFIFYEGPPTANGKPGIHHLESRAFKDLIPRYKTMQGYYVRRKAGWDTHGLPVEIEVEKELALKSKKDIEKYGIAAFNKKCRESVLRYIEEWRTFTDRIAHWVDHSDTYYTFDPDYIETLWHIVKNVSERKLLYKDYKVVPWCPRCGTPLSSHELAQGYADVEDMSVYVKFESVDEPGTYFLAWTTTPWTLPGNVALAVSARVTYVKVGVGREHFWLAEERLQNVFPEGKVIERVSGSELVGRIYKPLYPYLGSVVPENQKPLLQNAYKIYEADFVTTEDGTGIVHTAVMYGADDFDLGTRVGLPKVHLVNEEGKFIDAVKPFKGVFVKDADADVIADLEKQKLLFKKEKITHTYPFCWRCKTPLIYYARDSWYIQMSLLRDELVKENEEIHWEPEHIRTGRFGEWLREVKDWAISRDRYWGTPLPVWVCDACAKHEVIGSYEELAGRAAVSGNRYVVLRHGEAENNAKGIVSNKADAPHHLTDKGKSQIEEFAKRLAPEDIDIIYYSPFVRTKETAQIIASHLGMTEERVIPDPRLKEIDTGEFDGKSVEEYRGFFASQEEKFIKTPRGGENLMDVKRRVGAFLEDIEAQHADQKVLIVAHEYTAWMLEAAARGTNIPKSSALKQKDDYLENGETKEIKWAALPKNEDFELDPHKPYIDHITLVCSCGGEMKRVSEVMDVWFDSGAMPFAQDHYPFDFAEGKPFEGGKLLYPADYISEAIDQTRGWFYTLHAIGVLMERGKAYKNVICLGHILDAEGKKMSKSVGNVIRPEEAIEKFGVDALRFWMFSVNQPGEAKNFDERTVDEVGKKVLNILDNIVRFYELYVGDAPPPSGHPSSHVLDRWILSLFAKLHRDVTEYLDGYKVLEAARAIRDFIQDLSTWYVRRSRDRFKSDDANERGAAIQTTQFVLQELSKLIAPFMPFFADDVYKRVGGVRESVHLEDWPKEMDVEKDLIVGMERVREIVSLALEARARAGIKVRQPLARLTVSQDIGKEYMGLIQDEINVKEVVIDTTILERLVLDTALTPELKREGDVREFIRRVQDFRKQEGLLPHDEIVLNVFAEGASRALVEEYKETIAKAAGLRDIAFDTLSNGADASFDEYVISLAFDR